MNDMMSESSVSDDPIDREYLQKNYLDLGCGDVLLDVCRLFLDSSSVKITGLNNALADDNLEELLNISHALKGEAGSVGGRCLAAVAARLEKAARADDIETIRTMMPEAVHEHRRLVQAIEMELAA